MLCANNLCFLLSAHRDPNELFNQNAAQRTYNGCQWYFVSIHCRIISFETYDHLYHTW